MILIILYIIISVVMFGYLVRLFGNSFKFHWMDYAIDYTVAVCLALAWPFTLGYILYQRR